MKNEEEILGTALELEVKGLKFYTDAEKKTGNKTGKKMFAQLAKEEEEHIKSLKDMFRNLYPDRTHRDIPLFDTVVSEYSGEVEALRIAMTMEKAAIQFYTDWAQGNVESLFRELIEFEKKHLELLQAELDYVMKTGFWFDHFESSMED